MNLHIFGIGGRQDQKESSDLERAHFFFRFINIVHKTGER